MTKLFQAGNVLAFLLMVVVNYCANTGAINGETMASVSERFETYFTPAGYAFSIWSMIYLLLLGFVIYQAKGLFSQSKTRDAVSQIGWWFIVSCFANIFWILAWLNEFLGLSVVIMIILLLSLLMIIFRRRMELDDEPFAVIAFVWWPFCIYSGWITIALIANAAAYLRSINWNGFGISEVIWTIIMISVAGFINLIITWTRNMREFALVGAWGMVAIAVENWDSQEYIALTALVTAVILVLSTSIHGYKNRKFAPWTKL